jgi:CRISPR-associated protein Cas6
VPGLDDVALLSKRSNLLLRVDVQRADALLALNGLDLQVAGHSLHLGPAHRRELQSHTTLYAYKMAAESADEIPLMAALAQELAGLVIGGERVCGKRQSMQVSGQVVNTFSLMLHALPPDQSLRLQHHGLGVHRLLGCGIFVPHKSAAAV